MKYEKPRINVTESAFSVVQGLGKQRTGSVDMFGLHTQPAYEADE